MSKMIFDSATQTIRVGDGGIRIDPGADEVLTVGQQGLLLPDGSQTIPSIRWSDDTNTGIFSPTNESVAIASNGATIAQFGPTNITMSGINYPLTDGADGQLLKTDGAGNLSFVDPPAGGGGIASLSEDPAPSLGGNLTTNGLEIHSGTMETLYLRGDGGVYVTGSLFVDNVQFPVTSGATDGQVVTWDGSNLVLADPPSGGGGGGGISAEESIYYAEVYS